MGVAVHGASAHSIRVSIVRKYSAWARLKSRGSTDKTRTAYRTSVSAPGNGLSRVRTSVGSAPAVGCSHPMTVARTQFCRQVRGVLRAKRPKICCFAANRYRLVFCMTVLTMFIYIIYIRVIIVETHAATTCRTFANPTH